MNGRLDTFQAAVLLEKIAIFYDELARRREIAAMYDKRLADIARSQVNIDGSKNGYGYYTVSVLHRDKVRELMGEAGVPSAVYYKQPLHQMKAFAAYAPAEGLPNCEAAAGRVLSLPMHPYLTDDQVHFICDVVEACVAQAAAGDTQ